MPNRDLKLLNELTETIEDIIPKITETLKKNGYDNINFNKLEHPIDTTVTEYLKKLKDTIRDSDDDYHIFNSIETIKENYYRKIN